MSLRRVRDLSPGQVSPEAPFDVGLSKSTGPLCSVSPLALLGFLDCLEQIAKAGFFLEINCDEVEAVVLGIDLVQQYIVARVLLV